MHDIATWASSPEQCRHDCLTHGHRIHSPVPALCALSALGSFTLGTVCGRLPIRYVEKSTGITLEPRTSAITAAGIFEAPWKTLLAAMYWWQGSGLGLGP